MAGAMGYVFLYADINDFAFWKTSSDHKITKTCNTAQPVKPPLSETKNVVENKGFD
jgi:hypothetical protein